MPSPDHQVGKAVEAGHRIEIEFDGFPPSVKLIHPESGCPEGEGGERCYLTDWLENEGIELLRGKLTLPVRWEQAPDRDHPLFHLAAIQPFLVQPEGDGLRDRLIAELEQARQGHVRPGSVEGALFGNLHDQDHAKATLAERRIISGVQVVAIKDVNDAIDRVFASQPEDRGNPICICVGEREEAPAEPNPDCPIHGASPEDRGGVEEGATCTCSGRLDDEDAAACEVHGAGQAPVMELSYCGGPLDGLAGFATDTEPLELDTGTYLYAYADQDEGVVMEWKPRSPRGFPDEPGRVDPVRSALFHVRQAMKELGALQTPGDLEAAEWLLSTAPTQLQLSDEDRERLEQIAAAIESGIKPPPRCPDAAYLRKLASTPTQQGDGTGPNLPPQKNGRGGLTQFGLFVESLRWAVDWIDKHGKFGPEMPSGDTSEWLEWAAAHDLLKDADAASTQQGDDIEALVARVRERFELSPAYFDLGDGDRQEVDWDSVIGNVLHYAGALPDKGGDGA